MGYNRYLLVMKIMFVILMGCFTMAASSFAVSNSLEGSKDKTTDLKGVSVKSNCCCEVFVTTEKDKRGNLYRVVKCRNHSYDYMVNVQCLYKMRYPGNSDWSEPFRFVGYIKPRSECVVHSSPVEDDVDYRIISVDCVPND